MNFRKSRLILKGKIKDFYYSLVLKNKIKKYFKEIKKTKPRKVIYTCFTGVDYDSINVNEYLDSNYEYICFTDNEKQIKRGTVGPWQVRPLVFAKLDNQKNNRYHKFFPNELFPEFDESIYVDTNVVVKTSKLFDAAAKISKTMAFMAIPPHRRTKCIYDELEKCLKVGKDKKETLDKHRAFLEAEGFPKNLGLTENNVIYRKHNDPECIKIMQQWWNMIENYSKRDQLSLFYVLWKNEMEMTYLLDKAIKDDKKNFQINHHNV
ncbi:MAG: DUF616 domain-containing protein [Lactobacillaceae bacterium]|jgi:hypothetical protein|nr:DUF616 domain-containing protein [Lactobacillaceae bacterium]